MSQEERLRWVHFKDPPIQVSHTHAYSLGSMVFLKGNQVIDSDFSSLLSFPKVCEDVSA